MTIREATSSHPAGTTCSAAPAHAGQVAKLVDAVGSQPRADAASIPGAHWDVIAGERIAFLPQRGAWWERGKTLIVADLHLGKAETFAIAGAALSGGVLDETLSRVGALVNVLDPARIIIVGDLLHAPAGLTPLLVERVREWRRSITADIVVVPGNHDRRIEVVAREWDLRVTGSTLIDAPFGFVHDPVDVPQLADGHLWWVGHVHPCVWLGGRGDGLKLPCFIVSPRMVQLPAFSVFTSGVCVRPSPSDRVHVIADATVVPLNRG